MLPITILIPTMNRPDYLQRALTYYRDAGFSGCVLIGDSSEGDMAARVRELADRFGQGAYQVRLLQYPASMALVDVWRSMIAEVKTPYVTYAGDDDLQIPVSLQGAVDFLESNQDYVAVKCEMLEVWTGQAAPYGEIIGGFRTRFPNYDIGTARQRFVTYAQMALSVQYGVYRTDVWRTAYNLIPTPYLPYFGEEFFPCAICVVLGKIKSLPYLGTIQQVDGSGGVWKRHTMFDLIRAPEWPELARLFQTRIAALIAQLDRIALVHAEALTEQILWWHVNMFMQHHYKTKFEQQKAEDRQNEQDVLAQLKRSHAFPLIEAAFRRPLPDGQ